jgi:hypothetical protein
MTDLFIGTWRLVPELSVYTTGMAPVEGTYDITLTSPGEIDIRICWRMEGDATDNTIHFGGTVDGVHHRLPEVGSGPNAFTLSRIDERILDSAALRGDEVLAYARRVVSRDGQLMAVVQETHVAGEKLRNFQVYRRIT